MCIRDRIGGSQREEDYGKLVARMDELGMDKTNYEWYLNLRKFGGVEHAGYGLSLIHICRQHQKQYPADGGRHCVGDRESAALCH